MGERQRDSSMERNRWRERETDQRQETAGKAVEGVEGKDGIQIEGGVGGRWRNGMWEPGDTKAGGGE